MGIRHSSLIQFAALPLFIVGACASTPPNTPDGARERMLALLEPDKIEIVAPFTRVRSFDDDTVPDGIELLVQAVNSLDHPTMIVGRVHVGLFEYVPASGNAKGARLEFWDIELSTMEQQRTFWNQATQMYAFRLQINLDKIPPANRFVLHVTYSSPLGDHLADECVIDIRSATRGPKGPRRSGRTESSARR